MNQKPADIIEEDFSIPIPIVVEQVESTSLVNEGGLEALVFLQDYESELSPPISLVIPVLPVVQNSRKRVSVLNLGIPIVTLSKVEHKDEIVEVDTEAEDPSPKRLGRQTTSTLVDVPLTMSEDLRAGIQCVVNLYESSSDEEKS